MLFVSICASCLLCFFFKQKTAYELRISDWSSDVCSSDLPCRRTSTPRHRPSSRLPDNEPSRYATTSNNNEIIIGELCGKRCRCRQFRHRCTAEGCKEDRKSVV